MKLDVMSVVHQMRQDRARMVQTEVNQREILERETLTSLRINTC